MTLIDMINMTTINKEIEDSHIIVIIEKSKAKEEYHITASNVDMNLMKYMSHEIEKFGVSKEHFEIVIQDNVNKSKQSII